MGFPNIENRLEAKRCEPLLWHNLKSANWIIVVNMTTTIQLQEMNAIVLQKHHLTNNTKSGDIPEVVDDICALHATVPTTPYLSLFARMPQLKKEDLEHEMYHIKSLGKIRCMRKTLHLLTRKMLPVAFAATNGIIEPLFEKYLDFLGMSKREYDETSDAITETLADRGLSSKEIKEILESTINVSAILNVMCDQGLLIRGPPKGSWKSNIHTYYRFEKFFPEISLSSINEEKAKETLVTQYLASFGPATETDVSWWTGWTKTETKRILEDLQGQILRVDVEDIENDFMILKSQENTLNTLNPQQCVTLLPLLDPYIMGYKNRERYLNPEYTDLVFDRSGNATSTILLNGRIIGIWDFEETPSVVKVLLFEETKEPIFQEICLEAKRIGKFIAEKNVEVKCCDYMVPLPKRTAGGFMSPLKDLNQ
ncbi:MAG: AlkZ family DNA glycosylase [Theionarchaea archaeon]|nr:AlkZ family DNA glycosylase [Theionarchaea archaeon]